MREIICPGHNVKIVPTQAIARLRSSNKSDAIDAKVICKVGTDVNVCAAQVKSSEQQNVLSLIRQRKQLIQTNTQYNLGRHFAIYLISNSWVLSSGYCSTAKHKPADTPVQEQISNNLRKLHYHPTTHALRKRHRGHKSPSQPCSYSIANPHISTPTSPSELEICLDWCWLDWWQR